MIITRGVRQRMQASQGICLCGALLASLTESPEMIRGGQSEMFACLSDGTSQQKEMHIGSHILHWYIVAIAILPLVALHDRIHNGAASSRRSSTHIQFDSSWIP